MTRIALVDDDAGMCRMLAEALGKRGYDVEYRTEGEAGFAMVRAADFDVVVTDLNMRGISGLDLCERVVADRPDVPVIIITAFGRMDTAIGAIRAGAYDFLPKPFTTDHLVVALERAVQHRRLQAEVRRLRRATGTEPGGMIGASPAWRAVMDVIARLAESDATVLITGESGTGKELIARALHASGRHPDGPFVAINCAALPQELLVSELFGHIRGAFTDARTNRTGLFVQASGGTLLLDEIGELPLGLQPKLLRALESRMVRPLGGDRETPFDARIVASTNRDLEALVREHRFREDLFYRLDVLHIALPPLRARGNDVLLLAQHFLDDVAASGGPKLTLSGPAAERLLAYPWPGNVRELANAIERAAALAQYDHVAVEDLPERIRGHRRNELITETGDPTTLPTMDEVERRYITRVLDLCGGNKSLAAKVLGFDRTTLYRKLERYHLGANDEPST